MLLMGVDCGSTTIKATIFDRHGTTLAVASRNVRPICSKPGHVEQDMRELWGSAAAAMQEAIAASGRAPLVLMLDDLHWADKGTIAMLLHPARFVAKSRILVLGAYRDVELDRQHPLASARTDIEIASLMTLKAAWIFDQGREAGEFANMAKLAAADAGTKAVDVALQCFGGNGFTREYGIFDIYPLVRLLKTAPLNREMILNYIGEHVMGLPRSY